MKKANVKRAKIKANQKETLIKAFQIKINA